MRIVYKEGVKVTADFQDSEGKLFSSELRCPMTWSHNQSSCTALCAWYKEEEKSYWDCGRQWSHLEITCLAVNEVIGRIEKFRPIP